MKTTLVIIQIALAALLLLIVSPFILAANYFDYLYLKFKL
jgi:hypothetical protein